MESKFYEFEIQVLSVYILSTFHISSFQNFGRVRRENDKLMKQGTKPSDKVQLSMFLPEIFSENVYKRYAQKYALNVLPSLKDLPAVFPILTHATNVSPLLS